MNSIEMEALDFRYLLLEYYKKLRIDEEELAVILMIDHLLDQRNSLLTADLLAIKMTLPVDKIDRILVHLIDRGFLEFDPTRKTKTTLKPLRTKLYDAFQKAMAKAEKEKTSPAGIKRLKNIYAIFEQELGRTLSPLEYSLIQEWLDQGYEEKMIIDALKETLSKKKRSLRSVDRLLLQWQTRDDIEKTGYSAIKENDWELDMEKTMAIARAKWIDDE